jgi:hypothetical protein
MMYRVYTYEPGVSSPWTSRTSAFTDEREARKAAESIHAASRPSAFRPREQFVFIVYAETPKELNDLDHEMVMTCCEWHSMTEHFLAPWGTPDDTAREALELEGEPGDHDEPYFSEAGGDRRGYHLPGICGITKLTVLAARFQRGESGGAEDGADAWAAYLAEHPERAEAWAAIDGEQPSEDEPREEAA